MEKYLSAAEKIAKRAIHADPPLKPVMNRVNAELSGAKFDFPVEADYDIRAIVAGRKADMFHPVQLVVQVDGKDYKTFTLGVAIAIAVTSKSVCTCPTANIPSAAKLILLPFDEAGAGRLCQTPARRRSSS